LSDIRQKVFGRIAIHSSDGLCTGIDLSLLLQRLLLFDTVILESTRLQEVPHLLHCFGYEGLVALLESHALRIHCDMVSLAQIDNPSVQPGKGGIISISPLQYGIVRMDRHERYLESAFVGYRKGADLTPGRAQKLENLIRGRLIAWNPSARQLAFEQTKTDIRNGFEPVRRAITFVIGQTGQGRSVPANFRLNVSELRKGGYAVETDIPSVCGISNEEAAKAVSKGLLGVGGLNSVIEDMQTHAALTGVRQNELSVFDEKLDFVARQLDPEGQSSRLTRVLQLTGLPDIAYEDVAETVSIEKLLEISNSPECRAFRQWLWSSGEVTNDEIERQFGGFRTKLSLFVRSKSGKTIRWAASTFPGLIPAVGPILSGGLGLLDTFLTEKVINEPGPLSFLSKKYHSIFER
jgi:hypothetical protein